LTADASEPKPAKLVVFERIEGWYNARRRHSWLGRRQLHPTKLYITLRADP
jgi:transposase InsO family protein